MLIPQFSLRRLLATITGCSLAFLVLSLAVRGQVWAIGLSIGLLSLVVVSLLYGFTFFLVWVFATFTGRRKAIRTKELAAFLVGFLASVDAYAGGALHTLPSNGKPAKNGMVLSVDTQWPEGFGYRPLTITVTCPKPATADSTLPLEFRYHDWNPNNTMVKVKTDLEVPAGTSSVSKTVAVPDFWISQGYSLDTWDDGRHMPDLSQTNLAGNGQLAAMNAMPAVLFIAATQPADVSTLDALFPRPQYYGTTQPASATPVFPPEWSTRTPTSLPDQWLCYEGLDVVFVSLPDLKSLATTSPKVLAALLNWTRAGGNLLVLGVGADWAGLAELSALSQLGIQENANPEAPVWQSPLPAHYSGSFSDFVSPYATVQQVNEVDEKGNVVVHEPAVSTPPSEAPFRWRTMQQGAIVAIAPSDPFGATFNQDTWHWIFNTLGSARWLGAKRTGVSFTEDNPDFWMFLIPGVGGAPVDMYRVLITAFVVVIGPVNYLLLRKYGRLHLLLFTVPASALLVTAGLFTYAIVADGLETRVRSRSITLLDQRTQNAVSWSRLSFYSGLAPSGGLRFDEATAVIPYEFVPMSAGGQHVSRTMDITPDFQRLERGWLSSRTPTQFMTINPRVTAQKLVVSTDENNAIYAENRLGVQIRHLVVCDEGGQFGYASGIDNSAKAALIRQEPANSNTSPPAMSGMNKEFNDQALSMPEGFAAQPQYGIFGFRRRMMYSMMGGQSIGTVQSTGRLEVAMAAAKSAAMQAGAQGDAAALAPRGYIAIVDRPEEIELGLDGVTETEGFHVIRGNW